MLNINTNTFGLITEKDLLFLEKIINQNSQSRNSDGVNIIQNLFAKKLKSLGFENTFIKNEHADSGNLLISELGPEDGFTITTIGHADTVIGPEANGFRFNTDHSKILGAGIADNKSGQLIAIKGMEYYLSKIINPKLKLRFLSSPNEELGSPGFHDLFHYLGNKTDIRLGFEPSLPNGDLIHSRNGNKWFELEFRGHSYHSGRAPKGHMNAAHDFCKVITYLEEKVSHFDGLTLNIGSLQGGNSVNTICSEVKTKIDTRFTNFEELEILDALFENSWDFLFKACSKNSVKTNIQKNVIDFCPPMAKNKPSLESMNLYIQELDKITGKPHSSVHCGGAADINHLSIKNGISFDGLGAVGDYMHRKDEYILTQSLEEKSLAFGMYLVKLDEKVKLNEKSERIH